jgi:hypothetical protein
MNLVAIVLCCGGALVTSKVAVALEGCSEEEQGLILAYTEQFMQATLAGDIQGAAILVEELQSALSPDCLDVLEQQGQVGGAGPGGGYPQMPPNIYDHGGGMYSAPGLGACGPSGCISF